MAVTDIDFDELIRQLLPVRLRKPKLLAFLKVALWPLKQLYTWFKSWQSKRLYDIKYQSGCPAHLERVLNDVFDASLKRIFIGPGTIPDRVYLYGQGEGKDLYLGTAYLYNENDYIYGVFHFTINVPIALQGVIDEVYLKAVANRYKRDSKNYLIQYY